MFTASLYNFSTSQEKTGPSGNDIILIEDSENSFVKRKIKLSSIATGGSGEVPPPHGISAFRTKGTSIYEAWYTSPTTGTTLTSGSITANRLYAMPFDTYENITLDRIAINVSTLKTGNARLGIYNNYNGYPSDLLFDAGEISTSSIGVKSIAINETLVAGPKWLALVSSATPTIRCFAFGSLLPACGFGPTLGVTQQVGFYVSFSYAALPATYPTASPTAIIAAPLPAIFVRLSA